MLIRPVRGLWSPVASARERAGDSIEGLLKIYAKCLAGGNAVMRQQVEAALGRRWEGPGQARGVARDLAVHLP